MRAPGQAWKSGAMPKRDITPMQVPGDERAVLWSTAVGHLPKGRVVEAPGTLGPLMEYGVLTGITVEGGGVTTWLADPHTWTDHGPRIREAVRSAVDLDGWVVE
jgi:hypothetical protein